MTELGNKMDKIAKNGYRADIARHILKGQKDLVDRQAIALDIVDVMEGFDADTLTELYEHVKFLRKRQHILPPEAPDCLRIDEPEVDSDTSVDAGHARRTAPHGQTEGFDGKLTNPIPIKEE